MKIIRPAFLLAASAALTAPGLHAEPQRGLDLTVTGLHSAKGRIIACLWHEKTRFPSCEKSKTALKRTFPVTGTTMRVSLPLPAAGRSSVGPDHIAARARGRQRGRMLPARARCPQGRRGRRAG